MSPLSGPTDAKASELYQSTLCSEETSIHSEPLLRFEAVARKREDYDPYEGSGAQRSHRYYHRRMICAQWRLRIQCLKIRSICRTLSTLDRSACSGCCNRVGMEGSLWEDAYHEHSMISNHGIGSQTKEDGQNTGLAWHILRMFFEH